MRTFRDFMESALYDPVEGFYTTRTQTADFFTSPELHPAFGGVLADRIAALLRRTASVRPSDPLILIEAGCGNGTLASQVARHIREKHADLAVQLKFVLLERSRRDLTEAVRSVTAFGIPVVACTDVSRLPSFTGVLYSNELFDAFPAHLLQKKGGSIYEVYVDDSSQWTLGGISSPQLAADAAILATSLQEDETHAVSLDAPRWLFESATRLSAGFLLTVDYGKKFSSAAPNVPRGYRQHRIQTDLLSNPGQQDLTVPADFNALIKAGNDAGAYVESFESMARFLIDGGIEKWFEGTWDERSISFKSRAQIKTLIHPDGMGECFKVLIQRKLP